MQEQAKFVRDVGLLIAEAYRRGYELTFGEAWRTPEQILWNSRRGIGSIKSLHGSRLAIDFNLFKDGKWLKESADHAPLGNYWKSLDPANRWGGDFRRVDGNHYSRSPDGVKA